MPQATCGDGLDHYRYWTWTLYSGQLYIIFLLYIDRYKYIFYSINSTISLYDNILMITASGIRTRQGQPGRDTWTTGWDWQDLQAPPPTASGGNGPGPIIVFLPPPTDPPQPAVCASFSSCSSPSPNTNGGISFFRWGVLLSTCGWLFCVLLHLP